MKRIQKNSKNGTINVNNLLNNEGITLMALVIMVIVLLILAGISVAALTGENGILEQASKAKNLTEDASEIEQIHSMIAKSEIKQNKVGQKLEKIIFNTTEDKVSIYDSESGQTYSDGWYYITPEEAKTAKMELKNSYIVNYDTDEIVKFDKEKHRIVNNELLCIKDNLVYSVDAKNMSTGDTWGDAILHNFDFNDENSGWTENSLSFDGVDDGIEVVDQTDYSNGITIEIYFKFRGQTTQNQLVQILMMKRTAIPNGFFMMLGNNNTTYPIGRLYIDIGGNNTRFNTGYNVPINSDTYIQYTYDPAKDDEKGVLYINGKKYNSTKLGNIDNLIEVQNTANIQIGSDIHSTLGGTNNTYPLNGEIYATRLYNRPLTEQELAYNYNNTVIK